MDISESVRIDRWLWAARFFKTRSLAKTAIDGGKVHLDGQRTKPAKEIHIGQMSVLLSAAPTLHSTTTILHIFTGRGTFGDQTQETKTNQGLYI